MKLAVDFHAVDGSVDTELYSQISRAIRICCHHPRQYSTHLELLYLHSLAADTRESATFRAERHTRDFPGDSFECV